MTPNDRDLPHVRGDECRRCGAFDGEPHGLRCADAPVDDDTIAPATCGPVSIDGDGREVAP